VAKNGADYRSAKVRDIPPGEPWVPHSAELLASDAMRSLSRPAFLMLARIELEHCRHSGRENGHLVITYSQFVESGIVRRLVRPTIAELQAVGLLVVEHQGRYGAGRNKTDASQYRLTYLKSKFVPVCRHAILPGTDQRMAPLREAAEAKSACQKIVFLSSPSGTSSVPPVEPKIIAAIRAKNREIRRNARLLSKSRRTPFQFPLCTLLLYIGSIYVVP
jgi:hypothetical protein